MYIEDRPQSALDRWVECAWSMETAGPLHGHAVRPDGCMDILYSRKQGLQLVGTMTRQQQFDLKTGDLHIGLRFRPGKACRFLRIPAGELCDRTIELDGVARFSVRELRPRLDEAGSAAACRRLLIAAVGRAMSGGDPDPVQRAIEALEQAHGVIDIDWLASQAGISTRQFRRRCLEEVGLTPKHLARVLRFRRACDLAGKGARWTAVAADAGYFDQAHLIRDFREFTGATPMSVFSNTPDPPAV